MSGTRALNEPCHCFQIEKSYLGRTQLFSCLFLTPTTKAILSPTFNFPLRICVMERLSRFLAQLKAKKKLIHGGIRFMNMHPKSWDKHGCILMMIMMCLIGCILMFIIHSTDLEIFYQHQLFATKHAHPDESLLFRRKKR